MTAAALLCLVVAITDGDTLKARCGDPGAYEQVTIRLAEIDAPERRQPYGEASRQALADLCFQRQAKITPRTKDRYGRTVARVECVGKDASAELARAGMAWAYTRYLTDPEIKRLELAARAAGVGLWAEPNPVPPWEWRHPALKPSNTTPNKQETPMVGPKSPDYVLPATEIGAVAYLEKEAVGIQFVDPSGSTIFVALPGVALPVLAKSISDLVLKMPAVLDWKPPTRP